MRPDCYTPLSCSTALCRVRLRQEACLLLCPLRRILQQLGVPDRTLYVAKRSQIFCRQGLLGRIRGVRVQSLWMNQLPLVEPSSTEFVNGCILSVHLDLTLLWQGKFQYPRRRNILL